MDGGRAHPEPQREHNPGPPNTPVDGKPDNRALETIPAVRDKAYKVLENVREENPAPPNSPADGKESKTDNATIPAVRDKVLVDLSGTLSSDDEVFTSNAVKDTRPAAKPASTKATATATASGSQINPNPLSQEKKTDPSTKQGQGKQVEVTQPSGNRVEVAKANPLSASTANPPPNRKRSASVDLVEPPPAKTSRTSIDTTKTSSSSTTTNATATATTSSNITSNTASTSSMSSAVVPPANNNNTSTAVKHPTPAAPAPSRSSGPASNPTPAAPAPATAPAPSRTTAPASNPTPAVTVPSRASDPASNQSSRNSTQQQPQPAQRSTSTKPTQAKPTTSSAPRTNKFIPNSKGTEDVDPLKECDSNFANLVKLKEIPDSDPLPKLLPREIAELELSLQIGDKYAEGGDSTWRDDWNGNLQLIDKDIVMIRDNENGVSNIEKIPFCEWVAKHAQHSGDFRGVNLLFSYVYHMTGTPPMAKRIMSYYLQRPANYVSDRLEYLLEGVRRISYDPYVLIEDGWTISKAEKPDGRIGGAFLIGRRIIWQRYEAIVIAYVNDNEIGDLWKAIWIEDCDTFDLEADELQEGMRKWDKKNAQKQRKAASITAKANESTGKRGRPPNTSIRFEANRNFTVDGVEEGIILATSYNARNAVPWPARILHVTEVKERNKLSSRRSSSKNEIHVVFLAPYWNGRQGRGRPSSQQSNTKTPNIFSSGPLFEIEAIDVSEDTIKPYPYDGKDGNLSIDKLRAEFQFMGLSKNAFPRYLESHRMAIALKMFSRKELTKKRSSIEGSQGAVASLTDTHPLSVKAPLFPEAILGLPFEYIISQFPPVDKATQLGDVTDEQVEPIMQLSTMLKSLIPPHCWGQTISDSHMSRRNLLATPPSAVKAIESPAAKTLLNITEGVGTGVNLGSFVSDYLLEHLKSSSGSGPTPLFSSLGNEFEEVVKQLQSHVSSPKKVTGSTSYHNSALKDCLVRCLAIKGHGEDIIQLSNVPNHVHLGTLISEWRKACEKVYRSALLDLKGDGVTVVITDSRCNQHITATGSFERAVRLPAAIRAAKRAGSGSKENMPLLTKVEEHYVEVAETKILPMAHSASYLKRMKDKIAAIPANMTGVPLTDGSDGEGGDDTKGSRGSYLAAVLAVAAAIQGVDMVMGGKCINGFCAVRPPGHHAGKDLRAMNAVSNGFCLFNAAACAALYAASPISEGGLGLKRVCVIDFDVHHGNGTQDILCSTYDSRFLYVSTHVGGAHINGYEDDTDGMGRSLNSSEGIFPGKCGDTSPHDGVLNIPLGRKVTPQDLGSALMGKVRPKVEEFSPDLIIISAGFDAHKHDPLGMGGLSADNFGSLTEVICDVAHRVCSGRVISIMEGGYGVPCCQPLRNDLFLPKSGNEADRPPERPSPWKVFDLGDDLPDSMEDIVDHDLAQKLEKCHQEGFLECVKEHVASLSKNNSVSSKAK